MERAYTIPFRTVYNLAARKERAKRAMKHIREFVAKHMKVDPEKVKIHTSVNAAVWQRGAEKPPRKLRVVAVKEGEEVWVYTQEERAKLEKAPKEKPETSAESKEEEKRKKDAEKTKNDEKESDKA